MTDKSQIVTVDGVTKLTCLCNTRCGYCDRHIHVEGLNPLCPNCGYPLEVKLVEPSTSTK